MVQEIVNQYGKIMISKEVLATLAGIAATECFGVVGMASHTLRDGIGQLLGKESISKGVEIEEKNNNILVKVHIIVGYGTKISVIAGNVMQRVEYALVQYTGLEIEKVQVVVQDVRILD